MELIDYGSLLIVGAIASLAVELIKKKFATSEFMTLLAVVVISLIIGAVYQIFNAATWWGGFIQTLVWAGAVYAYLFKRFEKS